MNAEICLFLKENILWRLIKDCSVLKRLPDDGFAPIIKGITPNTETE